MLAGLTKFLSKNEEETGWIFDKEKAGKVMGSITETMKANTAIPENMLNSYALVLPWALLIVGATVMLGLFTRISLFLAGGLVLSLSFGLMLLMKGLKVSCLVLQINHAVNAMRTKAVSQRREQDESQVEVTVHPRRPLKH